MLDNRRDFLRKICVSGACMCGFGAIAASENIIATPDQATTVQDKNKLLIQDWVSTLLVNINAELDDDSARRVIKKTSMVHYNNLRMDDLLSVYIGDLDNFIGFIQEKWDWKIDYNKKQKTLIADENKDHCVCPISQLKTGVDTSAMCYCSEGFAEKMFSTVAGVPATATVVSSIRRGDKRCVYKVVFQ